MESVVHTAHVPVCFPWRVSNLKCFCFGDWLGSRLRAARRPLQLGMMERTAYWDPANLLLALWPRASHFHFQPQGFICEIEIGLW